MASASDKQTLAVCKSPCFEFGVPVQKVMILSIGLEEEDGFTLATKIEFV